MPAPLSPEISVVIPCYNGAATLPLQLEALATQQGSVLFEVVVVDNASTDDLAKAIKSYLTDSRLVLRVVSAHREQGASYARNVGIREALADRLMFCDADDVVSEWWVKHGALSFEDVELWSGGSVLLTDDDFTQDLVEIRRRFGDRDEFGRPVVGQTGAFPVLMGGNFGATRAVLARLRGFDQSLPSAGEDNDLGFRAHRQGVQVHEAPHVRIGYRGRWDLRSRRRQGRSAARAKALIASRYAAAWKDSGLPDWRTEPLRVLLSGARLWAQRADRSQWEGWQVRAAISAELLDSGLRYDVLRTRPPARLGVGWFDEKGER